MPIEKIQKIQNPHYDLFLFQIANVRASAKNVEERIDPRFFLFYWYTSTVTTTSTSYTTTLTFSLTVCTFAGSFSYSACG